MQAVESLMDAELMVAGVIRVPKPDLLPTEEPEIPGTTFFGIKSGYSVVSGLGFRTADDAALVLKVGVALTSDYIAGKSFVCESNRSDKLSIEKITVHCPAEITNHRSAMEKVAANKKHNESVLQQHKAASEAVEKIVSGVWENWRACQRKLVELQRVIQTFDQYLKICEGKSAIAMTFLQKAFPQPVIDEAIAWLRPALAIPAIAPEKPAEEELVCAADQNQRDNHECFMGGSGDHVID